MISWLLGDKHSRVFGLDILRATAILLVLYSHRNLISATDSEHGYFIYLCGFWGVELFFVLSGFLIGKQLLSLIDNNAGIKDYLHFLKKRWLRTLPLYYLVLGLYFYFDSGTSWKHIFFLQNSFEVSNDDLLVFNQSWSLTIEEYTYLILPILFFFIAQSKSLETKYKSLILIVFIILGCLISRFVLSSIDPTINYDNWIRKSTFIRLDAIAMGVLIAWVKIYSNKLFIKLANPIVSLFSVIIIFWTNNIGDILVVHNDTNVVLESTLGFTLVSLLLAIIIPFFDNNSFINNLSKLKLIYVGIGITAMLSYCIYLIHIPMYEFFYKHLDGKIPFKVNVFLMLITTYAIALLSYVAFERPIQKLCRKKELLS